MDSKRTFIVRYEHLNEKGKLCWGFYAHCETEADAEKLLPAAREKSPTHNARIDIEWS